MYNGIVNGNEIDNDAAEACAQNAESAIHALPTKKIFGMKTQTVHGN